MNRTDCYVGDFDPDGTARLWRVEAGERRVVPHVAVSSPAGLAWGYIGNGPADTARSILADASRSEHVTEALYAEFQDQVVDRLPRNAPFELPVAEVRGWLRGHGAETPASPGQEPEVRRLPTTDVEVFEWAHDLERREMDLARCEARLLDRERALTQGERRLANEQAAWGQEHPTAPAWHLPAEPVAEELRSIMADTGDGIDDCAKGLGVDVAWARDVLDGRITEIDLPHVQDVCEALHCTPYDFWGLDAGRAIAHAYGPELWPRFIEPLDAWPPRPLDHPSFDRMDPPEPPGPGLGL
jgi:hypothetical protein